MVMMMKVIMTMMIVPHVVVVGRALVPMVLVVVGFQLLIHVNGQPAKAKATCDSGQYNLMEVVKMTMVMIPIVVTLVGIVTAVSDEHPQKALLP